METIAGVSETKHSPAETASRARAGKTELVLAGVIAIALLLFRWFCAYNQPWGSDEPQHLHVVWAWATGLVPYRDIFDNHTPLFHLLYSPIFHWLGERPDIVVPMRLAIVPLFALSLWCIYRLGSTIFSPRVGLWGALFASLHPLFFYKMAEFRTDVLWATLWLVTLVILTGGPLTRRRLFWAGVALGATFCVSMKTILLFAVALAAGALVFLRFRWEKTGPSRPLHTVALDSASGVTGLMVLPCMLLAFFASKGALKELYYCVIEHNTIPGEHTASQMLQRLFEFPHPLLFLAALLLAVVVPTYGKAWPRLKTRLFLLLVTCLFYPVLHGFWTIVTPQDNLPWYPLVMLCLAPGVLWLSDRTARWLPYPLLPFLLVAAQGAWMWHENESAGRRNKSRTEEIAQALRLTKKNEFLMDAKGDMIFRPRPYYYVLETITCKRLALGLLPDELPQHLIETRTAVVRPSSRMTSASQEFVEQNYVSVGKFYVLGRNLKPDADGNARFQITIPSEYTLVDNNGLISATLDGLPFDGSRWLEPGEHTLRVGDSSKAGVALVWTRAAHLGFSPFHKPPLFLTK